MTGQHGQEQQKQQKLRQEQQPHIVIMSSKCGSPAKLSHFHNRYTERLSWELKHNLYFNMELNKLVVLKNAGLKVKIFLNNNQRCFYIYQ